MNKWEYKTVILDAKFKKDSTIRVIDEECNKYGSDGWELVNFQNYDLASKFMLIFKRPIEK